MAKEREKGAAAARKAIAEGRLTYFSGAPSKARWGIDLADTLQNRFNVEVVFVSDMTTEGQNAFRSAFNSTIEEHIEQIFGKGSLASALAEVQERRLKSYEEWRARQPTK